MKKQNKEPVFEGLLASVCGWHVSFIDYMKTDRKYYAAINELTNADVEVTQALLEKVKTLKASSEAKKALWQESDASLHSFAESKTGVKTEWWV